MCKATASCKRQDEQIFHLWMGKKRSIEILEVPLKQVMSDLQVSEFKPLMSVNKTSLKNITLYVEVLTI